MELDYIKTGLMEATQMADAARGAMNAARKFSKKWGAAAEDLEFWTNKKAFFHAAMLKRVIA